MTFARLRPVRLTLLSVLVTTAAFAQAPAGRETTAESVAQYALTQQMPVDPEVALGTLPNGLRYYVRPNSRPARRAELRLVVKAGSVLEDDDQLGLAHFVEHMQFEGTKNFPKQSLTQFLQTLGMSIGADANAATSYDDTQYILRVPTDVPGALDRALLVLSDWAGGATFDQDAIDRQRGIVLSEWRMNLGAGERTVDKILRVQLQGSRYPDRRPIGRPEVIEKASRDTLMRFYRDWYRPDLMAVIVTGEIDREAVVKMITNRFSMLSSPSPARPRPVIDVPEHPGTRYAIVADRETTATAVQFSNLRPARNQGTVGGYRSIMLDQLFAAMLGERFDELAQKENAPFIRAAADRSLFRMPRTKDQAILQALVPNDGVARGLEALVTELRRVALFGFTETELARAKQERMAGYERVVAESPDRESESRADEYTRNFLQGEALPTIWQELAFHRRFLPGVTLKEINALTADWFPETNRVVIVSAPEAAGVTLPDQAQLAAVLKTAESKKLEPYVDAGAGEALMETPPARGSIVKTTARPDGITEWTLSNGATVLLKPTSLRVDQILFRATAPGGTSVASDADFVPARVADDVVSAGGVGKFSAVQLDRLLTGKSVGVTAFIGEIEQGMGGGSTPQDLETMFQLLYLRFTQPRADQAAFAAMRSQARALLANRAASPDVVFNQTIDAALSRNHPRRQPETTATVDQWNLAKSLDFYKARFADASAFRFVFVGSFTVDAIKPLVETYLASLPATHANQSWRDPGIVPPAGIVEKTVEMGIAPKSQVAIVFSGAFDYTDQNLLALRTMTLLLQSRLLDAIRQELGGTYSITATPGAEKLPKPQYSVRIEWTCDPARTQALVARVFEEIENVKGTNISREWLGRIRDVLLREYQDNIQENGYILNLIASHFANGGSPDVGPVSKMTDLIGTLTGDRIRDAARTYLKTSDYVRVTLMPAGKR
ncbi:MAG TPA: insulinase family protein [Vicinamibacterales bacterium]|nr:insulinase family protein [Vicinamibacterales bacterium]